MIEFRNDIDEHISDLRLLRAAISLRQGSRELSSALTKLDEARMWLTEARVLDYREEYALDPPGSY